MADFVQFNTDTGRVLRKLPYRNTPDFEGLPNMLRVARLERDWPQPARYLIVEGGILREMTTEEKAIVDTEQAAAMEASVKNGAKQLATADDENGRLLRALLDIMLDEINTLRALHSLPARTLSQLKTQLAGRIDSGDAE